MLLGDIIERNALLYPGKEAVVDEHRRLTFSELADRTTKLANAMIDLGVTRGHRVAFLLPNSSYCVETYGACEMCGFIAVPLNVRQTEQELAAILSDSTPAMLIYDREFLTVVEGLRRRFPDLHFICVGGKTEWAAEYDEIIASRAPVRPAMRPKPDDTAFIIYTSGTTGRPKGVMHSHRGQIYAALSMCLDGNVAVSDRMLVPNPMYMAGGKWMQMTYHFRGCTVFLQREFDPGTLLDIIERERVTGVLLPATMLRAVLDHPDFDIRDWSSLKSIYYASSPTPEPLLRRALKIFGPILVQYYGGTEGGGVGTTMLKEHHKPDGDAREQRRLSSAGQAKALSRVRIVRADGSDCAAEETGEIIIQSDGIMQGYWNNLEATAEALRDGWVYTGDIGFRDDEYFIFIVGRKKEMIISGGANIYPREVEDTIGTHPAVLEVAVFGVPHEKWGESVHAAIVLRPGHDATSDDLIEYCRSRISSYKKPTGITFLERLPKLDSGKVDKMALANPYWAGRSRRVN